MSSVAENVIPVPEVVEHFGDAEAVIARLMGQVAFERARLARRLAAYRLAGDCAEALGIPFCGDFGLLARLRLALSSLQAALSLPDNAGAAHPRGLGLAVKAAEGSLARFNRALAVSRAAGL